MQYLMLVRVDPDLDRAGRLPEAAEAYASALALVRTEPERVFLARRLRETRSGLAAVAR